MRGIDMEASSDRFPNGYEGSIPYTRGRLESCEQGRSDVMVYPVHTGKAGAP